jgi:hypothetical protein
VTDLPGIPSDDAPDVLATGRGDVGTLFVSMARRHPDGLDAEYLRWHTLDHRPEQHRLSAVRASLRLVSTPACRAARILGDPRFDGIDHVMTYFFTDPGGMTGFLDLSHALGDAGRKLALLPPVERGVYGVDAKRAAPRVKVGADVLPWWPIRGAFLIIEREPDSVDGLLDVAGVAGVWTATALDVGPELASAAAGQHLTYCFLDEDPVTVAHHLQPVLALREPLFAAPFHPVIPYEWDRYVPHERAPHAQ